MLTRLVFVASVVATLVACSSHWSAFQDLDPVAVDFATEDVSLDLRVRIEQPAGEEPLDCEALVGTVVVRWTGDMSVPIDVGVTDAFAAEDQALMVPDESLLVNETRTFAQDGDDACEIRLTADLSSEAGAPGELAISVSASDTSAGPGDDPSNAAELVADVTVERTPR